MKGCTSQKETIYCSNLLKLLRKFTVKVLEAMALINHKVFPSETLVYKSVPKHNLYLKEGSVFHGHFIRSDCNHEIRHLSRKMSLAKDHSFIFCSIKHDGRDGRCKPSKFINPIGNGRKRNNDQKRTLNPMFNQMRQKTNRLNSLHY